MKSPFISPEELEPFAVRWGSDSRTTTALGPLAMADDLVVPPFELTAEFRLHGRSVFMPGPRP